MRDPFRGLVRQLSSTNCRNCIRLFFSKGKTSDEFILVMVLILELTGLRD